MDFILASGSASRQQILRAAAVPYRAVPADIDEAGLMRALRADGVPAQEIASHLADAKAEAVAAQYPDALVLGADQTLLFGDSVISKCVDLAAARALLARLRGRAHLLVGGLSLRHDGHVVWRHVATSRLVMRPFSDRFLDLYLATEGTQILASVGAYRLEGMGAQLFEAVEGDYFSILGLSLQPLLAELRKQGVLEI